MHTITTAYREIPVLIIGAGLSGLQAAVTLQQAGVPCLVVEARNRIGGKAWSREWCENSAVADLGPAWINDSNQSRMVALARRFELETIVQNTDGDVAYVDLDGAVSKFRYGGLPTSSVEPGGVENMVRVRDLFERLCHKVDITDSPASAQALGKDYDNMSMADFVREEGGGETAFATVRVWTRAMLGLEPRAVSALYFLAYCKGGGGIMQMRSDLKGGGQYLRLAKGTQQFAFGLAGLLSPDSVVLGAPVDGIRDTGNGVLVSSGKSAFRCQRVIVSVPTTLYKAITFEPPLPPDKLKLADSTVHGYTSKCILAYKEPWWRKVGLCGLSQCLDGLVAVTRDVSNDAIKHWALLCFLVGEPGRPWGQKCRDERQVMVKEHIKKVFSPLAEVPEPIAIIEQDWTNERWSQGCPCPAMPPGVMSSVGHALREPHGKVHFVGTETNFEWRGYMEGAVRSGERGASEVLQALRKATKL